MVEAMRARVYKGTAHGRWVWVCDCGKASRPRGHGVWHVAYRAAGRHVIDKHGNGGSVGEVTPVRAVATHQRYRCTVVGCNPALWGDAARDDHTSRTGHRTAKWPVRSAEGKRRAKARNRSGYYDRYNVGHKARGGYVSHAGEFGDHPGSPEALGQW